MVTKQENIKVSPIYAEWPTQIGKNMFKDVGNFFIRHFLTETNHNQTRLLLTGNWTLETEIHDADADAAHESTVRVSKPSSIGNENKSNTLYQIMNS